MEIKLIATDLDDTLMRPDKSISEYSASVLRRCRERGIRLCFVTARSLRACERVIRLASPEYMITCGGAHCQYGKEELLSIPLSIDEANDIVAYSLNLRSVRYLQADTVEGEYFVSSRPKPNLVGDYAHAKYYEFNNKLPCGVYKLVITIEDEGERLSLAARFPNARVYNYVGGPTCFIASKEATKLRGLEAAASHMGVGLENIAAFGDDIGDADYLAACGYGVAVENAVEAAKKASRYICAGNDDDGVARWLEERVL